MEAGLSGDTYLARARACREISTHYGVIVFGLTFRVRSAHIAAKVIHDTCDFTTARDYAGTLVSTAALTCAFGTLSRVAICRHRGRA